MAFASRAQLDSSPRQLDECRAVAGDAGRGEAPRLAAQVLLRPEVSHLRPWAVKPFHIALHIS